MWGRGRQTEYGQVWGEARWNHLHASSDKKWATVRPRKVMAITGMKATTNLQELRRFLGMVKYLANFLQNLWHDDTYSRPDQEGHTMGMVREPTTCMHRNTKIRFKKCTSICILWSKEVPHIRKWANMDGKPVVFANRTLTETERWYAQVKKDGHSCSDECQRQSTCWSFRHNKFMSAMFTVSLFSGQARLPKSGITSKAVECVQHSVTIKHQNQCICYALSTDLRHRSIALCYQLIVRGSCRIIFNGELQASTWFWRMLVASSDDFKRKLMSLHDLVAMLY